MHELYGVGSQGITRTVQTVLAKLMESTNLAPASTSLSQESCPDLYSSSYCLEASQLNSSLYVPGIVKAVAPALETIESG